MEKLRRLMTDNKGISLLEVLSALALLSIVASGIIYVSWMGVSSFNREDIKARAQYDARLALDKISTDILECKNLGDINPGAFEVRDKNGNPVPQGSEVSPAEIPMQLYLEKTEYIDEKKTDCTVIYLVNSSGQLCRQRRVFANGSYKGSAAITENRVNAIFSANDGVIIIKIIVIDEEDNPLFELVRTCKPRMD